MKLVGLLLVLAAAALSAADTIKVFGREWTVRVASDWKVDQEEGAEVLRLASNRGPLPGPRRPIQFALAEMQNSGPVTVEADVKPLGRSLMIVFAYRDEAHFNYAHLSTDRGAQQPVHNGIFHVYGGERVRISNEGGPAAFAETRRWYHVRLVHDPDAGTVRVTVDGQAVPALEAVERSLGSGQVGIGSFDETAEFRDVVINGQAAAPPVAARGPQAPTVVSPEVLADHRISFRIYAPQAQAVRLVGGDIPGLGQGAQMSKAENGVWEAAVGPIGPGAYRYNFNVDGVSVIDPRNPSVSESNNNVWSLVHVAGSDFMDTNDVPHGAVAEVTYFSKVLNRFRRMHVYTPPGYENERQKYPVFYLLHGSSDSDDSWSSVGRAGFIMDNLIAAKKAKPMLVVMPAGHTNRTGARATAPGGVRRDEFVEEFLNDIMPAVESRYRVLVTRENRAIAGLSMGGSQTLNIAIPKLDKFAYIGVYSSGLLGAFPNARPGAATPARPVNPGPSWEEQNRAQLDDPALKKGLKLFWFSTGVDDFLMDRTRQTVDLFNKHGFTPVFKQTSGAHTWINWRNYLNEFAPQLFK